MTQKEQNINNWLLSFLLITACFFLFSAIQIKSEKQRNKQTNQDVAQCFVHIDKSTVQIIPYTLPKYINSQEVTSDLKLSGIQHRFIETQSAIQTKKTLQLCLNSYQNFKASNIFLLKKEPGFITHAGDKPAIFE